MLRLKRTVTRSLAELSSLYRGERAQAGFRVFLYHSVGTRLAHDSYGISIDPKLFERHMALLAQDSKANIVSFADQIHEDSALHVAVTFDDGYKDNLYTAAPILLKYGIPFTVFVVSSFIKNAEAAYLSAAELRELSALPGVTIGSHGANHLKMAECDDSTLRRELSESKAYIEDVTGRPADTIAYPHGSVSLRVRDAARREGYRVGGCSRFDINDKNRDPLLLCRCEVLAADSAKVFTQKLYGAWDWYRWRHRDPATQ